MKIWSKYNTLFKREGIYLFYNSLSNSFVELSQDYYDILSIYKSGDVVNLKYKELESYLIRMKAVVEDDDYEIRRIKFINSARRFSQNTLTLTINPTFACNFACPYCFEENHPTTRMSDETEDSIIKFIKGYNPKNISVTWFGGEPLLEFDRIKTLTKKLQDLNVSYHASIITNGYLLSKEKVHEFEKLSIRKVQVTLDGVKENHDCRRFLKGGKPTFDIIYNNLVYIGENLPTLEVGVRVNIDKDNSDTFIDVFNLLGTKYPNIKVIPAFVDDVNNDGHLPCVMNIDEKFSYLRNLFRKYNLEFNNFYPSYLRMECAVRNPMSMVIGPDGELYKCWNDVANPKKVYGDIYGNISNEKILIDYLTKADPFENHKCNQCILLPVCSGGCPYARIIDLDRHSSKACPLNVTNLDDYLWEHYLHKAHINLK
ncbi:MAG: radical SAM protein [Bacteroidales bacterium]|nr:radical SAM protein [Bacteroidales bacterium]